MDQPNQVSISIPPPDVPLKRKRGRPRKDPSQNPSKSTYTPRKKAHSHGESAHIPPPGFERMNGNQPHEETVNDNNYDSMVGQVVTGVVEAAFEAGYLLSVRVGDSDTSLRGVVFKPGHYVPVSAENDVAPTLQMIRRNEVPFPSGNKGHKRRGRKKRSEYHATSTPNGSPPSNQLAHFRAIQMPIVAAQAPPPVGARGTVVPVVLQPVTLSNGATPAVEAPPVASQPSHLAASKGKQAPLTQAMQEAVPKGSHEDGGSASQPFEELVSVAKRMQVSSDTVETNNERDSKMSPKDSGLTSEHVEDLSKPLSVKPLQAIRSGLPDQSGSLPRTFPERRAGKMTELLLAVQENLIERQMAENQHHDFKRPEN